MIERVKKTWNDLSKKGKLIVVVILVMIGMVIYGQF
tara:strand:+ start:83 stop:190 length:108 start_codon:yes stop_codon:yes gene_type:complete